ncbi:hypothetical protein [Nocardioides lacusdianchii]|uniref:hypothetical protein n=1 Tax=Nocardioides lacusdianchii TaxID=2783664 RepID=UPI001CCBFFD2|nr:hypothetical protein [Nocardioides lacusdianchii]
MNPTSLVSGVITLPAHVAAAAAGTAAGLATSGARTTIRVLGWAVGRVTGPSPQQSSWAASTDVPPARRRTLDTDVAMAEVPIAEATPTKPPARKGPASKKAPARKKAPSKKAAVMAPALGLTEAEAEDVLRTPSGIPAAGDATNPDTTETDLHQPGTEPLMDPATVKAVKSESDVLRRAADTDKG